MSSLLDDEELVWCDSTRDYVLKGSSGPVNYAINEQKDKFNFENLEGQFQDEYDEFEIGISKSSCEITEKDDLLMKEQHKLNRGVVGDRSWRDGLPLDLQYAMGIEYDDEYYDDEEDF